MKILRIERYNVAGGCSFGYLISELLKENGIKECNLEKTWNNKKTVFIIKNNKYIISNNSYIFNYDGVLELEEFYGKTRKINGTTIVSSFANPVEAYPSKRDLLIFGYHGNLDELLKTYTTLKTKSSF